MPEKTISKFNFRNKRLVPMKVIRLLIMVFGIAAAFVSCSTKDTKFEMLQGEWMEFDKKRTKENVKYGTDRIGVRLPIAFKIGPDSIDFYNGIFEKADSGSAYMYKRYCGNLAQWHLSGDSIYT